MRPAFRGPVTVRFTRRLYHASLDAVRDELADVGDALRTVMVIGHNPGWEEMLARLCGQDRRMTTANAALLTIDAPSWSDALDRYAWTLTRLLRPKEL